MLDTTPLDTLGIADPETHAWVKGRVLMMTPSPARTFLELLTRETIWALSLEKGLGRAVADGLIELATQVDEVQISIYLNRVHQAATTGPTLARILSVHLVPVIRADGGLLACFDATIRILRTKGTYTLSEPLEFLDELLNAGDAPSAEAYLELLAVTFAHDLSYNRSVRLVHVLPQAVRAFPVLRRLAQIKQLTRLVHNNPQLIDPFLEGMQKGVALLAPLDLERFVGQGLAHYHRSAEGGIAFLSLSSVIGQEACVRLQKALPLRRVKALLERYLFARLGRRVPVRPMSDLKGALPDDASWICSDGRRIFLPDEIHRYDDLLENEGLAKQLVRLESCFFECHTFALDFERALDRFPALGRQFERRFTGAGNDACAADSFAACFHRPDLAADLLTVFEMGRVMAQTERRYPGLANRVRALLQAEASRMWPNSEAYHLLAPLYGRLILAVDGYHCNHAAALLARQLEMLFRIHISIHSPVEDCTVLAAKAYAVTIGVFGSAADTYSPLPVPFGWRPRWQLYHKALGHQVQVAASLRAKLDARGVKVYQTDLQNRLAERQGRLSVDDIRILAASRTRHSLPPQGGARLMVSESELTSLVETMGMASHPKPLAGGPAFQYPEWDEHLQDYRNDHVRVEARPAVVAENNDFYLRTRERRRGLLAHMRRAFEMLKPEGLVMLRQWPEGDAFDHRALIDFVIDRRAGRMPSDRLFIKRLKKERDVAVLLLVDLSRSTANTAADGQATVIQVAKEALVLFCEALQVVGDTYAIAGFSGTGRHSVDYFRIKDFQEPLSQTIQDRISGLHPQRSTRMGAAIRHATAQLAGIPSRVRLLILVSDGFPNDLDYKGEYAVADSRRAAQEARARNVQVKAITVNIGTDPRLDDLYGRVHHHVIGDVSDLPDKLLRLYGILTRRG